MTITRIAGNYSGRSRAVMHNGLVYTVATDTTSTKTITEQTRLTLLTIEKNLRDAGSDKNRIIQATVYLKNMAEKTEMDAVWREWIGDDKNVWPQRACVGADLAENDMIEIVIIASLII